MGSTASSDQMRFNWLLWAAAILLAALCAQFFGVLATLLLCGLCGLAYCCVCFVCFVGEAYKWRVKVDKCYETLFQVQNLLNSSSNEEGSTKANLKVVSDGSKLCVQGSKPCHKEAQKFIELIMRDFVYEWYKDVTNDEEFPEDVEKILEHVALETNIRIQRIDLDELVCELLANVLPYLEVLNEIGMVDYNGVMVFDVENEKCLRAFENNHRVAHRALRSPESELRYYRQALDTLVQYAVPPGYRNCDIACTFVRELLLKNIIEPLFNLLCDPDFLLEAIPIILEKASPEKVRRELVDIEGENEELEKGRLSGRLRRKTMSQRRRFMSLDSQFVQSVQLGLPISSSPHIASLGDFADQGTRGYDLTGASYFGGRLSQSQSSADLRRKHPRHSSSPLLVPKHHSVDLSSSPRLAPKLASASPPQDEFVLPYNHGEDVLCVNLPPIYVTNHVRVESGSAASSYIGYIIKFPKHMLSETDLRDLGVHESETHLEAMKRYSHFIKFHDALRRSPLAIYVKGLELPDKRGFASLVSKLPFTAKDPDITVILERKQGLERYLQSVSSVDEVTRSELFREFLRSGVHVLKEANIVNPLKPTRRRTLLERMKGRAPSAESAEAVPLPKKPMESVLSLYLDTHLPLPCQTLHSEPDSVHPNPNPTATTARDPPISSQLQSSRSLQSVKTPSKVSVSNVAANEGGDHLVSEATVCQQDGAMLVGQIRDDSEAKKDDTGSAIDAQVLQIPVEAHCVVVPEENQTIGSGSIHSFASASIVTSPPPPNCIPTSSISQVKLKSNLPPSEHHKKEGVDQATSVLESNRLSPISSMYSLCKSLSSRLLTKALEIFSFLMYIIRRSLNPLPPQAFIKLAKEREQSMPLSNVLLSLGSEVSKKNCPQLWACNEGTQIAILSLFGGGMERFLWKELHEVVYSDENWTRALYHLRHTLWPGGKLMSSTREKQSEEKRVYLKKKAAESFKKFLPNFLPYIVGSSDYDRAVQHCIQCIQNSRMNRHFLLRVIDVILPKIVPEMQDKDFHGRLVTLRTANIRDVKYTSY